MLVLSRKAEESIRIGENITITVLKVKGRAIQIGIDAPRELRIRRGEFLGTPDPRDPASANSRDRAPSIACARLGATG